MKCKPKKSRNKKKKKRATWPGHFDIGNPDARLERGRAQRLGRAGPCRPHVHQALLPTLPDSGRKAHWLFFLSFLSLLAGAKVPGLCSQHPRNNTIGNLSGIEMAEVNNGSQVPVHLGSQSLSCESGTI